MMSQTKENCTVPWTRNNSKICTNSEDIEKAFSISWNRGTNQMKDCKKPCHSLEISQVGDNIFASNKTVLRLYFKSVVTKSQEEYLYTLRNLFAEIGGYVGIF